MGRAGGEKEPTERELLLSVQRQADRTQRMAVLIGFSLMVASLLCVLAMVRGEMWSAEIHASIQRLDKRLDDAMDQQRLQTMAIQRIGGMTVALTEELSVIKQTLAALAAAHAPTGAPAGESCAAPS